MKQEIINRIKQLGGNVTNVKGTSLSEDLCAITFNTALYKKTEDTPWLSAEDPEPIEGLGDWGDDAGCFRYVRFTGRCFGFFVVSYGRRNDYRVKLISDHLFAEDKVSGKETGKRTQHDPHKKILISDLFFYPAGNHTRKHHT